MIGKLNHIAIATPNLKDAAKTYEDLLGAKVGQPIPQMEHGVTVIFIELPNTKIELLEPLTPDSPIGKFLKNKGEGVQQIAVKTTDIVSTINQLQSMGIRMINDVPVSGANGTKIAFVHPFSTGGVLVELVEH